MGFLRVTGPGAGDAGVMSERITALETEEEAPPEGLEKLQRAHVPVGLRGAQLCNHLPLWCCRRASVKPQKKLQAWAQDDAYFGTGSLRDVKFLLDITFVTDVNTIIYLSEYFFHFSKVPVHNYSHKLSPICYLLSY